MKFSLSPILQMTLISAVSLGTALQAAPIISINLNPNDTEGAFELAPTDTAGFVPASNWNNVTAPGSNYTTMNATDLADNTGSTTGTEFNYFVTGSGQGRGGSFITANTAPDTTPDDKMMKAAVGTFDAGGITNYEITGLPADFTSPGYIIYAYWGGKSGDLGPNDTIRDIYALSAPGQDADGETFVMGYTGSGTDSHWDGTYTQSTVTSAGDFEAGNLGEFNFIRFSGLTSDSFTITVTQNEERRHGQLSGIQIVAIPEPSTLLLLGIALGSLLMFRRQK
ncbi:MAG: PEP-CTERM sorting domain-containing protein [Verrucomicrobia bacterium]|nr:PEP-CTERM sorting domain-containing protein [Verrucomicrobiota bacterium]MCH8510714.1 PEP-CTERM sorting domain-containing protein [Kiritimatiellia bacterium]